MKREFLEGLDLGEGAKLPKSAIDAIMAENGWALFYFINDGGKQI